MYNIVRSDLLADDWESVGFEEQEKETDDPSELRFRLMELE